MVNGSSHCTSHYCDVTRRIDVSINRGVYSFVDNVDIWLIIKLFPFSAVRYTREDGLENEVAADSIQREIAFPSKAPCFSMYLCIYVYRHRMHWNQPAASHDGEWVSSRLIFECRHASDISSIYNAVSGEDGARVTLPVPISSSHRSFSVVQL